MKNLIIIIGVNREKEQAFRQVSSAVRLLPHLLRLLFIYHQY